MKKKIGAVLVAAMVLGGAGVAFALWTANGSGSGNAQALTANTVTVNAVTGAADLYPGFADGDVHFTFTNTNPYPVTFNTMTSGAITSRNEASCPAANLTVDNSTGLSLLVGPNTTSGSQSIADVVTLASAAPDGCQGITFTVALTLSGTQSS